MEEKDLHCQLQKTDEIPKNEFEKKWARFSWRQLYSATVKKQKTWRNVKTCLVLGWENSAL